MVAAAAVLVVLVVVLVVVFLVVVERLPMMAIHVLSASSWRLGAPLCTILCCRTPRERIARIAAAEVSCFATEPQKHPTRQQLQTGPGSRTGGRRKCSRTCT